MSGATLAVLYIVCGGILASIVIFGWQWLQSEIVRMPAANTWATVDGSVRAPDGTFVIMMQPGEDGTYSPHRCLIGAVSDGMFLPAACITMISLTLDSSTMAPGLAVTQKYPNLPEPKTLMIRTVKDTELLTKDWRNV